MEKLIIKKRIKKCFALAITLVSFSLFFFGAVAQEGIQWNDTAEVFPFLKGWLSQIEEGMPYEIKVSANIHELLPFTEDTIANLDRLVSHMSAALFLAQNNQGLTWGTDLYLDKTLLFSLGGINEGNSLTQWTNIGAVSPLTSTKTSPLYELLGVNSPFEATKSIQLPNFEQLLKGIPTFLKRLTVSQEEKKSGSEFKKIGKAAKVVTYQFDEGTILQLQSFLSDCIEGANWHWGKDQNNRFIYEKKGTLKVYYTKENEFLALSFTAPVLVNDQLRNIEGFWAGNQMMNRFEFKLPADKGKNLYSLEGEITLNPQEGKVELSGKRKVRNDEGTIENKLQGNLIGAPGVGNERVTGEITLTTTAGEDQEVLNLSPSILTAKTNEGTYEVKGSIRLTKAFNKKNQSDISISLVGRQRKEGISIPLGKQDYDSLTELQKKEIGNLLNMHFTSAFSKALFTLPKEDILFITETLSPESLSKIFDLLQ